jgi:serine/threonine protein phosphatase 1
VIPFQRANDASNYKAARRVAANTRGRDFLLADLHGCFEELLRAMEHAQFNPQKDRIFSVGDLIDRGPKSLDCLALLTQPWFFAVQGNHENMMLASLAEGQHSTTWMTWMLNGGEWFADLKPKQRERMWKLLPSTEQLPVAMTLELEGGKRLGIAHAQPPRLDWSSIGDGNDLTPEELARALWGRDLLRREPMPQIHGVDVTVHGHTIVEQVVKRGKMRFIDTGAYMHRRVQLLEVNADFLAN